MQVSDINTVFTDQETKAQKVSLLTSSKSNILIQTNAEQGWLTSKPNSKITFLK
jgi:hypothetical protein